MVISKCPNFDLYYRAVQTGSKSLDDRHKLCKKTMLETALNMSFKHIYNVQTISIYFCDYYDIKADDDVDTFTDDQNKQWKQYS